MANAYQKVFSRDSLWEAWRHLYKNAKPSSRNTVGSDAISINDFERNAHVHLRQLHNDLASGHHTFSDLRPVLLKKRNGKDRLICIPTVRDRVVQRAILNFLAHKYSSKLKNRISYGFLPDRSVQEAAAVAVRIRNVKKWVFKTDITAFFDRIPRDELARRVEGLVRESSLHQLLRSAVSCEIGAVERSHQRRISKLGIRSGLGVRQGMPLSPFFSNVLLQKFDEALVKRRFQAVRYADDLIFFADSEVECFAIFDYCQSELGRLGLEIPSIGEGSKSEIYAPAASAEFLGLSLAPLRNGDTYTLMLSAQQFEQIRKEMGAFSSLEELLSRGITLKNLVPAVSAKAAGYLHAYQFCSNYDQLENLLTELTHDALRRLYKHGLGLNLHQMSGAALRFLGLPEQRALADAKK